MGCHCCRDLVRYRQFLGIQKEQQNIAEEQAKLKQSFAAGTDIVSPDNLKTIAAAKEAGTPADKCAPNSLHPSPATVFSTCHCQPQYSIHCC